MNYLVSQIVNFITEQDVISDESDVQDFYRYGIEISISSLLNIVLVVIAGILIHHIIESIVFLSLFILIRSFTGGYHADTYFRCNLLMCTTFILTALANSIFSNKFSLLIIIVLICVTELIVSVLGPIENKNKPIDDSKKIKLKITGTAMTSIINCAGLILRESYLGTMIIFTTFLIVLLMIAAKVKEAKIQERGGNSCEKVQENDS
ncbi:accessory gene regulator B family protein [Ruminococcus bicirculans (ex Wegman et al. 2014)]|uniref:accessory gene regulator B family protein n=1 Tax=Ruminococcus bicirculans (ex Wegman et al. 2014) TaxID=1160721 RepID=UPI0022E8A3C2|nr:accessory gene regulator B family protein [Ruminococcus bicirculans (ex Wegman et al. 2014)]